MWGIYLSVGIGLFAMLSFSCIIASRAGRSPYFALLMLFPYVQVVAIWVFAFTAWPKADK